MRRGCKSYKVKIFMGKMDKHISHTYTVSLKVVVIIIIIVPTSTG